jgi:hypothetical protein
MGWIQAKDISQWQGNWQDTGEPIIMMKMAGGDNGLYMDTQAIINYESALKAGRAGGGYFFAGGGNPSAEHPLSLSLSQFRQLQKRLLHPLKEGS